MNQKLVHQPYFLVLNKKTYSSSVTIKASNQKSKENYMP